jgi:pimeloyl-ACP methyl ester carboxylesterase
MNYIESRDAGTGEAVKLSYEDFGTGSPVVLIHGWPLSKEMWEYQLESLVNAGLRVITYDRRGFGKSDRPWGGYDYDSLTDDLRRIIQELDLSDVTLVGFSMGGGEVARYFTRYSGENVSKVVLISSIIPFMLKTDDNPEGLENEKIDAMMNELKNDRISFLEDFGKQFFGVQMLKHPVSTPLLEYYRMLASIASARATQECMKSFSTTDFRKEAQAITVPTFIIHGDADKTVPIEISSHKSTTLIPNNKFVVYEGAPHGLFYTHRERLNMDLVSFITTGQPATDATEPTHIATDRSAGEYVILPSNEEGLITRD